VSAGPARSKSLGDVQELIFFAPARNFSFSSEVQIPVMFASYDSSDFSLPELETDGEHIVLIILHSPEAIGSRSFEDLGPS